MFNNILKRYIKSFLIIINLMFCAVPSFGDNGVFPGAIGFGKNATGWRGGTIITVTNLNDAGSGSLRACLEDSTKPRVCTFAVSGTILLTRPIFVASNVYLAGQTAPGNGIQLRLRDGTKTPFVIKNENNVLIRYLKIRPGAGEKKSANIDAVTIESSHNVYLDALSLQFASDETFNIHVNKKPVHHITLARSILSHSLDRSVHPKGKHSKGALICSNEQSLEQVSPDCGLITIARNLFAHHRDRNPDIKGTDVGPIEIINNIFFDPISQFGEFYDLLGDVTVHYIGNLTLPGPSTKNFFNNLQSVEAFNWDESRGLQIYEADNLNYHSRGCRQKLDPQILDEAAQKVRIEEPVQPISFPPYPAEVLVNKIIQHVGANLSKWGGPDALDRRAIDDFQNCEGNVINKPNEVGGWPNLTTASNKVTDQDGDGLPDDWEETRSGLDPFVGNQTWEDRDNDGWSNIEEYLSSLTEK
jgi:pectate lyase